MVFVLNISSQTSIWLMIYSLFCVNCRLDQQIWGSEDEEDLEEEQDKKKNKEEEGKGESTGEKEMAAKEKEQGTDDGSDGKERKEKKDINEMEEPEVDDDHVRLIILILEHFTTSNTSCCLH